MFRTKSEFDLKEIVLDPFFPSYVSKNHKIIFVSNKSDKTKIQSPVKRVNVTKIKDIKEVVKLENFLSKFNPPVSELYTIVFPASDSTLYATT